MLIFKLLTNYLHGERNSHSKPAEGISQLFKIQFHRKKCPQNDLKGPNYIEKKAY